MTAHRNTVAHLRKLGHHLDERFFLYEARTCLLGPRLLSVVNEKSHGPSQNDVSATRPNRSDALIRPL
jgi:hypothetical protein